MKRRIRWENKNFDDMGTLTHWVPELFAKNAFLDISRRISTKLPLISSKRHLQPSSLPFLLLALYFTIFWLGHVQKSKLQSSLGFLIFVPFSPFLFFFAALIGLLLGLLAVKKSFQESVIETGKFDHGVAMCSGRKFYSDFFTQLFEHFCEYLRLHKANHSDLGIIGKIFSFCRSWP